MFRSEKSKSQGKERSWKACEKEHSDPHLELSTQLGFTEAHSLLILFLFWGLFFKWVHQGGRGNWHLINGSLIKIRGIPAPNLFQYRLKPSWVSTVDGEIEKGNSLRLYIEWRSWVYLEGDEGYITRAEFKLWEELDTPKAAIKKEIKI